VMTLFRIKRVTADFAEIELTITWSVSVVHLCEWLAQLCNSIAGITKMYRFIFRPPITF
jgi:hypothetical protein